MSLRIALADWSATPVMGFGMEESIPAVNKPNTAPRPYPEQKTECFTEKETTSIPSNKNLFD